MVLNILLLVGVGVASASLSSQFEEQTRKFREEALNGQQQLHGCPPSSGPEANWLLPDIFRHPDEPNNLTFFIALLENKDFEEWCPSGGIVRVLNGSINIRSNGTLNIKTNDNQRFSLGWEKYCVFKEGSELSFKICESISISTSTSKSTSKTFLPRPPAIQVRKCCPEHQILDGSNPKGCINVTSASRQWFPVFYRNGRRLETNESPDYTFEVRKPQCSSYIIRSFVDKKALNLEEDGDVTIIDEKSPTRKSTRLPCSEFCIDGLHNGSSSSEGGMSSSENTAELNQGIIVCRLTGDVPQWVHTFYATVNHTAALFLLLTAGVYVLLWPDQNIHGWLQFSYVLSLFFAFTLLAVVQVWSQVIYDIDPSFCSKLGWLIHFTILCSFFWLTSMNFDIFWGFSGRRYLRRIRSKPCRENIKRYVFYVMFSLLIPILITTAAVSMDKLFEGHDDDKEFWFAPPRFGASKCYFQTKKSQFPYLYLPVGVLLAINLIFFSSTVVQLRQIHSNTELARTNSTLEDKNGVRLISKLFVLMGVLWIFELVSWGANVAFPDSEKILLWIFMPTEILNSLQGIAIFGIFICKPNILNQLSAKFLGSKS